MIQEVQSLLTSHLFFSHLNTEMAQKFKPKKGGEHAFRFDATPTYLFRLYAPSSAGETNTVQVSSPIYNRRTQRFYRYVDLYRTDILKFTSEQAAERLSLHLWWECGKTCNLMSWSSSLLFLLQYGLYHHTKDNEPPSLSDIYLIMIDTREYKNSQAFKSRTIATVGAMKIIMDAHQ